MNNEHPYIDRLDADAPLPTPHEALAVRLAPPKSRFTEASPRFLFFDYLYRPSSPPPPFKGRIVNFQEKLARR
ncbi:hypothetical protein, partial [Cerasicoccus arenae]